MRKLTALFITSVLGATLVACGTEHSDSCEWERRKQSSSAPTTPKNALWGFEDKVGGTSGGGSRGGSSGSRSGGGVKMNKPGGGGSASKPKFNKSNPAPRPTSNPGFGNVWVWDCD